MAIQTYAVAAVKISNASIGKVESGTLTITTDTGETTSLSDSFKTYAALAKAFTCDVTVRYDPVESTVSALQIVMTTGASNVTSLAMFVTASKHFIATSDSLCTNFSVGAAANTVDTLSLSFQGNGALTYSAG